MRAALALALGLLGLAGQAAAHDAQQQVLRAVDAWPIDPFTLTDQHGRPFTQDRLSGRWTFVLFGDSACGAACADAMAALDGLFRRIAPAEVHKITQGLLIAEDGRREHADRLLEAIAPFEPRVVAGVGTAATVAHLADEWRGAASGATRHSSAR